MATTAHDQVQILHVDDEPSFTDVTQTYLERENDQFTIETANSADEGLSLINDRPPDCIVSDFNMPGKDGLEFLADVRETHPELPFILFTGKGSEAVASQAISTGVTDYIQKDSGSHQFELLANRIERAVDRHRAERELERQNRRLSALFENFPEPTLTYTYKDGKPVVSRVNDAFTDTFGYSEQEAIGESVDDLIVPEAHRDEAEKIDERVKAGERLDKHIQRQTKDGIQDFSFRNISMREDEEMDGFAIYTDITELKDQQRELERQNDLFTKAQEIADLGAYEYDVSEETLRWTDQVYEIYGVSQDYNPMPEKLSEFSHQGDYQKLHKANETAIATGEPYDLEARLITNDGDQRWIRTVADPQVENDEVVRVRGVVQDITKQKEREMELSQYEYFFNSSPDQIAILDKDGTVKNQSPSSPSHELNAIDAEGENVFDYVHPEDQSILADQLEELIESPDQTVSAEFRVKDASGDWRWVETRAINLLEEATVGGIIEIIRDMTEKKQHRLDLKRQNERLDEFTSAVSHDLRSPLRTAQGQVELAQQECDSEHLDDVAAVLDRGLSLIEELTTLSRQGDAVGETDQVNIAEAVDSCWRTVSTDAATRELQTDQTIHADESRLKQLLEKLISNAVTHGGEQVTVTIGEMAEGFYIADDGPGIPAEQRENVFDAGYTDTEDGTGFGLNIAKRIAEAHGWEITVTESVDGGARFEITGLDSVERT